VLFGLIQLDINNAVRGKTLDVEIRMVVVCSNKGLISLYSRLGRIFHSDRVRGVTLDR